MGLVDLPTRIVDFYIEVIFTYIQFLPSLYLPTSFLVDFFSRINFYVDTSTIYHIVHPIGKTHWSRAGPTSQPQDLAVWRGAVVF